MISDINKANPSQDIFMKQTKVNCLENALKDSFVFHLYQHKLHFLH